MLREMMEIRLTKIQNTSRSGEGLVNYDMTEWGDGKMPAAICIIRPN